MIDARHGVKSGFSFRVVDFRQAVDLFDVEDGVTLHVWDFTLDILAGLVVVLSARDAVGVDDERAFLAFAHMRVEFESLAKSLPDGRGEIVDRRGHPERENVDSAIGLAAVPQRAGKRAERTRHRRRRSQSSSQTLDGENGSGTRPGRVRGMQEEEKKNR